MFLSITVAVLLLVIAYSFSGKITELRKDVEILNSRFEHLNKELKKLKDTNGQGIAETIQQETHQERLDDYYPQNSETVEEYEQQEKYDDNEVQYKEDYYEEEESKDIEKRKGETDFEKMFLGNIFNIIGAIAIIFGCGFFIKLISPMLTPMLKVTLGFIIGILMIIGAYRIQKPSLKRYSEVLMGTGFSVLFITVFCMSALFDTFSALTSSIIGGVILIAAYVVADNNKTMSMPVIALTGGYLNIIFASGHVDTPYIFGYLIFLNILSVIFVYRNPSKSVINIVNLVLTLMYLAVFRNNDLSNAGIVYPLILWGVYLISGFKEKEDNKTFSNLIHWTNLSVLCVFSSIIFEYAKSDIGLLLLFVSVAYTVLTGYAIVKNLPKIKLYAHTMLLCILLATLCLASGIYLVIALSVEALLFAYLIKAYKYNDYLNWVMAYIVASVSALFFTEGVIFTQDLDNYTMILNIRLLGFIFPIIASLISYLMFNKSDEKKVFNLAQAFKFAFISLIFMYIAFELNDIISYYMRTSEPQNQSFIKAMLYSIITCIYSLQMYRFSKSVQMPIFNNIAIPCYAVSLILLMFGHTYIPEVNFIPVVNIRCIAYLFVIAVSVLYARREKLDVYKYIAVIIGFALIHFEAKDTVSAYAVGEYLISVCWILYAGIITATGIFLDKKYLKLSGIWLSILSVIRIFLYDLANVDMIYKLISFVTLGIIFMYISYYYNKKEK